MTRSKAERIEVPSRPVQVQAPPELPRPTPQPLLLKILPVVMLVAVVGSVAFMVSAGMARNPMAMMFPVMMAVSVLGMLATSLGGGTRPGEVDRLRKDYLRHLGKIRDEVRTTAGRQRSAARRRQPDPAELHGLVGTDRMWVRERGDDDLLAARLGPGPQQLSTPLAVPDTGPVEDLEPVSVDSLRRLVGAHSVVADVPVALDLAGSAVVSMGGDLARVRSLATALVAGIATTHSPLLVRIAVVAGTGEAAAHWEWLKWLPHHQHPGRTDGAGTARLASTTLGGLEAALGAELTASEPDLIVIVDGHAATGTERFVTEGGIDGVTVLDICGSRAGRLREIAVRSGICLRIDAGGAACVQGAAGDEEVARADALSVPEAERLAMSLARHRVEDSDDDGPGVARRANRLPDLLALGPPQALDPQAAWRRRQGRDRLRVPVGLADTGSPVEIDLKESAQGGMGPHGLCVGATGSGKSEFLRTLVLALVATHDPEQLNVVLVDFKGGATFHGFEELRHVSATITNLQSDTTLVDRMRGALEGEVRRRQELLRSAGNFSSVDEYEAARAAGAPLDPLPALFVVVDEFSELLSARPEFAELFLMIGRLGRSLHIHLLLASQRLEEGRLRGLDSHLSYRVALKTFSAAESRSVLGVTDAYHLPARPGAGYLKVDAGDPVRFDSAYVSGPWRPEQRGTTDRPTATPRVQPFTAAPVAVPEPVQSTQSTQSTAPDVAPDSTAVPRPDEPLLDVIVGRLRGHGTPAHAVWLEPLGRGRTLGSALDETPVSQAAGAPPVLALPLAEVDVHDEHRRSLWRLDLAGARGNVAVVGGARAGTSIALCMLVLAATALNAPDRLAVYGIDLTGGPLTALRDLPHVGSLAHRGDVARIRRTVAEVVAECRRREAAFRERGIAGIEQARTQTVAGPGGTRRAEFPEIILVVDGWGELREAHEDLEQQITRLAAAGLAVGVHVVVAAKRWAEIRPALRDALGTRVELALGDAADSVVDRRASMQIPADSPGRGLDPTGRHMLVLQPRLDGSVDAARLAAALRAGANELAGRWRDEFGDVAAAEVRMLPEKIDFAQLGTFFRRVDAGAAASVPIGIDESDLGVAYADFARDPLWLVFGDSETGKTSLLRTIAAGLAESGTGEQIKIVTVDYRRGLLGRITGEHKAGYAASEADLAPAVAQLREVLTDRLPGPDVTPDELAARSWWSGPHIYLLVDDLDLVATSAGNPLAGLVEFLPHARDIGLTLVVARRASGAARAQFDPVISRMRDLGCAGIVLSGPRDEGPLVGGVRPRDLPAGRAQVVTRSAGVRLVQTAWSDR